MNEKIEAGTEIKPIEDKAETKEVIRAKHAGGRPRKYTSPEELNEKIEEYFKGCREHKDATTGAASPQLPSIAELSSKLGMSRHTFYNYELKDEYLHTIKAAREYIIGTWEKRAINSSGNVGGLIFIAKNYGFVDKQEIEHKNTDQTAVFDVTQLKPDELVTLSNMLKRIEKQEKPVE